MAHLAGIGWDRLGTEPNGTAFLGTHCHPNRDRASSSAAL